MKALGSHAAKKLVLLNQHFPKLTFFVLFGKTARYEKSLGNATQRSLCMYVLIICKKLKYNIQNIFDDCRESTKGNAVPQGQHVLVDSFIW